MRTILKTAMLSIFILTLAATARPQDDAAKTSAEFLTETKITGAWQLNYAESDDPIEKLQTLLRGKLFKPADEKTIDKSNEPPTMSVSLVPPETLIIADGVEKSITINEGFNEIVFTRTVAADGVTRTGDLQNGAIFSVIAEQNGDSLRIETESPRKNRMIETYAPADRGKKLIVTVRFEDGQAKEIVTFRRVYDRTPADIFTPENQDFQ